MGNDLIDQAVFFCLLCGHIVIALGIQLDLFQRLTRVLAEHPVHLIADIDHVLGMDLDIRGLAGKAAALLAETGSAQRSDCLLDRACFQKLRQLAEESRCVYLQTYVRAMIDAANLRALVRAERMHMDPGFLQEVLFEGGSVTPDAIRAGASEPAALFRSTALREAAELGEAAVKGGSLTDFEKACDNAVLRTAAGARRVPFGVEVALGYLIAKEAEWTAVRIVMAGRLAGLSADAIRERLRDTYV